MAENVYSNDSQNLPHYSARQEAGRGASEEPVYNNTFIVNIFPPSGIGGSAILSAQVTAVSGVNTSPGSTPVEQIYKGATRSFDGGMPDSTVNDLTLNFNAVLSDQNKFTIYKILRAWRDRAINSRTGERGVKKNYIGHMVIDYFNREGNVFRRVTFYDCFITSDLPELMLDYTSADISNLDGVVFRSDLWDEEME